MSRVVLQARCQMEPGAEQPKVKAPVPTKTPGVFLLGTSPDLPQPWFTDRAKAVAHGKKLG